MCSLNLQLGWKVSPSNTRLSHWGTLLMEVYWWHVPLLSFFLNISSLHLLGLHSIWLFILQLRNWFTRSADVSESFHMGATIVESSAYLKSTGMSFIKTSRSLRKTLNKYGPPPHNFKLLSFVTILFNWSFLVFLFVSNRH